MKDNPFGFDGKSDVRPLLGGVQYRFRFANGYGASVVQVWELVVLDSDGYPTFDTPITEDVLHFQAADEVAVALEAVRALS